MGNLWVPDRVQQESFNLYHACVGRQHRPSVPSYLKNLVPPRPDLWHRCAVVPLLGSVEVEEGDTDFELRCGMFARHSKDTDLLKAGVGRYGFVRLCDSALEECLLLFRRAQR